MKNLYFRSPKNIVLNKGQIISYFSELHKLNGGFIKGYVDSINSNLGISSFLVNSDVYKSLGIKEDDPYYPSTETHGKTIW